jgi:uncharacterized membrane protein YvlD (DUF360 family)
MFSLINLRLSPLVSSLFSLPFFGFSSFGVFFLVCFALSLVGWVLKSFSGGDDK